MPRKNANPAAKKRREKLAAKMNAKTTPKPRHIGMIAHAGVGAAAMAMAAMTALGRRK